MFNVTLPHTVFPVLALVGVLVATHADATDPVVGCFSAKRKAATKSASADLSCVSKAMAAGVAVDPRCLLNAGTALSGAFVKAEGKGGCLVIGDAPMIATLVDGYVAGIRAQLGVPGLPALSACTAAKLKAAAKTLSRKGRCYATAPKRSLPVDPDCLAKAEARFTAAFADAEALGDCIATGDAAATQTLVDACLDEIDTRLCVDASGRACGALSTALAPQQAPDYYVDQANKYFDNLDTRYNSNIHPNYSTLVARWELPPWLYLTGYGRFHMIQTTLAALKIDPSTVPIRDCRAFAVQPFARCVVSFQYAQGGCPIYEEFTFNDQGEMTFIEAWSDLPGYLPTDDPADRWAEGPGFRRLSTKVPGLGNATGLIDLDRGWMRQAARQDAEVADFVRRAKDWAVTWLEAFNEAGPDYFARGCGWVP